ncbi:MAG: hypothetical protein AB3N22_20960 [Ruegeria sp.]
MTLIFSIQTKGSIWLLADCRLSAPGRQPIDDAVKVASVKVNDGQAIIGYSGIGTTIAGSSPSDWIISVLRGRHFPLEKMLETLAGAMERQFPAHLRMIPDQRQRHHVFVVPAFLNGEHKLYFIEAADSPGGLQFRFARHVLGGALTPLGITVPLAISGSGAPVVQKELQRAKNLLRLVKAFNKKKISADAVADELAKFGALVHQRTKDGSVGPNFVVLRRSPKGSDLEGGIGSFFYTNGERDRTKYHVPTLENGVDMGSVAKVLLEEGMRRSMKFREARLRDKNAEYPEHDSETVNRRLNEIPDDPDEKLR